MSEIDDQLDRFEDGVRRLKIEYEKFFNGAIKRPPADLDWRVQTIIKRFNESNRTSFSQRFRFNALLNRYGTLSAQWNKKLRIKEEGYRRPQDALLGIAGLRTMDEADEPIIDPEEYRAVVRGKHADPTSLRELFDQMCRMRESAGLPPQGDLATFTRFIERKSSEIQARSGCDTVEFTVRADDDTVRLNARPVRAE